MSKRDSLVRIIIYFFSSKNSNNGGPEFKLWSASSIYRTKEHATTCKSQGVI